METFKKKQPADYENPYVDMMADINSKIKYFRTRNNLLPNYIIINTADMPHLVKASHLAKVLPTNVHELTVIQSARLMPSDNMPVGSFDVVGN